LSDLGFENISYTENNQELTYTLESVSYRLTGVGVNKAISIIQKEGLPQNKSCRVIILDNNVPQISLLYSKESKDSLNVPQKSNWVVSYELGENWKEIKKEVYGEKGTVRRDELEREFQGFKIGLLLKKAREEKHLTQTELGDLVSKKREYISRIENNGSNLTLKTLYDIVEKGLGGKVKIQIEI